MSPSFLLGRAGPLLVLALLVACRPSEEPAAGVVGAPTPDTAAIRRGVDATNRAAEQAVAAGDLTAFVRQTYTPDATILPPGGARMSGHDAIEGFWTTAAAQMGLTGVRLRTDELVPLGPDAAYEIGTATIETGEASAEAKYVVVWKRGAGDRWLWHVDIWNDPANGEGGG